MALSPRLRAVLILREVYGLICDETATALSMTHDQGATWSALQPNNNGISITPLASSADGTTVLGEYLVPDGPQLPQLPIILPILISHDGGASWAALPSPPNRECNDSRIGLSSPLLAPDGTIFAECRNVPVTTSVAIYSLSVGASTWHYRAQGFFGVMLALALNANGHATALWGNGGSLTINHFSLNTPTFGLQYLPLQ